jgi:hypothetical protein
MVIFLPVGHNASSTISSPSVLSALAGSSYSITVRIHPSKISSSLFFLVWFVPPTVRPVSIRMSSSPA